MCEIEIRIKIGKNYMNMEGAEHLTEQGVNILRKWLELIPTSIDLPVYKIKGVGI